MAAFPRPDAVTEARGNTIRIVHGPIRLAINTDTAVPAWAWPQIADLAAIVQHLADQLIDGRPDWIHEPEGDIDGGNSTTDVAPADSDEAPKEIAADDTPAVVGAGFETYRRYARVDCPDCGRSIARAQLTNHRRHKHPDAPPDPPAVPAGVHRDDLPNPAADDEVILGDDTDGFTAADLDDLEQTNPDVARAATNLRRVTSELVVRGTHRSKPIDIPPSPLARLSPPLPDDEDAEPLTWGVNGESPPKVAHWSRHEDEQ